MSPQTPQPPQAPQTPGAPTWEPCPICPWSEARGATPWHGSLYIQVLIAIALGIGLGLARPEAAKAMKPLADAFINLIKMMIAPIIFCTLVTGIAGTGDTKRAGRIGLKAILYFEIVTTLALILGLAVVNIVQPGAGVHFTPTETDAAKLERYQNAAPNSLTEYLLHLIPRTFFSAFTDGDILQILVIAVLFAVAVSHLGDAGRPVLQGIEHFAKVLFRIMSMIMRLAPLGAFGAMAFTVGDQGAGVLKPLLWLMGSFYLTCLLFIFVVLGTILRVVCGLSIWQFLTTIRHELLIVLGTSSSESVLPRMIERMTQLGCSRSVSSLVIPTGYSFNLDGTCIYLTMAAVFIAQATDTPLGWGTQLWILAILLLTSKGAAGVTGSGFIVLIATLASTDTIPVAGTILILGVDRFMSEARALTNLIGNGVAALVIARWENALNLDRAQQMFADGGKPPRHYGICECPNKSDAFQSDHQTHGHPHAHLPPHQPREKLEELSS